jgi:diacylglycerol O-acyltransferase
MAKKKSLKNSAKKVSSNGHTLQHVIASPREEQVDDEKQQQSSTEQQQSKKQHSSNKRVDEAVQLINTPVIEDANLQLTDENTLDKENAIPQLKRSLSHIGRFSLITEVPTNKMISTGYMLFEHSNNMNQDILKRIIQEKVVNRYSRFRSTVSGDYTQFIDMGRDFNIDDHFKTAQVDYYLNRSNEELKQKSLEELEELGLTDLIGSLVNKPLDRNLPLWEMITIDNYTKGFIALFRIHHCIGDGTSISIMISEISDNPTMLQQFRNLKQKYTAQNGNSIFYKFTIIKLIVSMFLMFMFVIGLFRILLKWTREVFRGYDPVTRFKGKLGEDKTVGYERRKMKLSNVKSIGKYCNATVNDVMMTCFAGALDRYCAEKGDTVKRMDIRMSIPVNIRTDLTEMLTPSNKFGFIVCRLPLGIQDPLERLQWMKKHMDYNKQLPEQYFSYYVGYVTSRFLSPSTVKQTFSYLSGLQTAVMTNVRGPSDQLVMNGVKVIDLIAFAPQPNESGIGTAVCSYNGYINLSVVADKGLVPDAHLVSRFMVEEYEVLDQMTKATTFEKI